MSFQRILIMAILLTAGVNFCGCGGYSNEPLYSGEIVSVYVEMFENKSFRRGAEFELVDALAKRIEADTPYKIISSRSRADSVISGQIEKISERVITIERQTGRAMEDQLEITAVVKWKNLRTGELMMDNEKISASASFSEWQSQGKNYGRQLAANRLAERIVEQMENEW